MSIYYRGWTVVDLSCRPFSSASPLQCSARDREPPWQGFEDLSLPADCPMNIKTAVVSDATSNTIHAPDGRVGKVRSFGWAEGCCGSDIAEELMRRWRVETMPRHPRGVDDALILLSMPSVVPWHTTHNQGSLQWLRTPLYALE